ncbi:MAG: NEW3 domain-containing protein [Desulfotomaculales bacterium]
MPFRFSRLAVFLLVILILGFIPAEVWAQGGIVLSTPYPGVSVQPGETVHFPLRIRNDGGTDQKVELVLVSAPKGWPAVFKGGEMIIHQVLVPGGKEENVDFQIVVPPETKPGSYDFALEAQGPQSRSALWLNLRIEQTTAGTDQFVAQYPILSGASGTDFSFRVSLRNNGSRERSYSLGAQAPPGWQVAFSPAYENKQIASLSLQAGNSQDLDISVKPPQGIRAGRYQIPVEAVYTGGKVSTALQVVITGDYRLEVTTPSERLNGDAVAGRENPLTLVVKNTGSTDLQGVNFSASAPENWFVTFQPEKLDILPAGESQQVTALIKPDGQAIAGDYVVQINASTPETAGSAEFRITVKTPTLWGVVGIFIIALVVAGVGYTFSKYGRR